MILLQENRFFNLKLSRLALSLALKPIAHTCYIILSNRIQSIFTLSIGCVKASPRPLVRGF
nr:hypothetical protein Q903MT_gene1855 [Picea sitchensis]